MGKRKRESNGSLMVAALLVLTMGSIYFVGERGAGSSFAGELWVWISWTAVMLLLAINARFFYSKLRANKPAKQKIRGSLGVPLQAQNDDDLLSGTESGAASAPVEWSKQFIETLDRPRFERLCQGLWQQKGYLVQDHGPGMNKGVDFYLCAGSSKTRVGAVRFEAGCPKQISVKALRKLQKVVASQWVPYGLLMHNGSLSEAAEKFLDESDVTIKLNGADEILAQVLALPEEEQAGLLQSINTAKVATQTGRDGEFKVAHSTS